MARLDEQFDATQVAPSTGERVLLPPGKYVGFLTGTEFKPTKKGDGVTLAYTFQVTDGEHAGVDLMGTLNWRNPSQDAQKIGRAEFSAICHAVGVMQPQDTEELHHRPMVVDVRVEESPAVDKNGQPKYDEQGQQKMWKNNKIGKFEALPAQGAVGRPVAQSRPPVGGGYQQPQQQPQPQHQAPQQQYHQPAASAPPPPPAGRSAPWGSRA